MRNLKMKRKRSLFIAFQLKAAVKETHMNLPRYYTYDDGMPRYYAIIHEVISSNSFKVRISWLNSETNDILGPLNMVSSGFIKTCGAFRTGHRVISESLNSFSHKVTWTKGELRVILVFPEKGDVWLLHRDGSPKWNESFGDMVEPDRVIHEYDMIKVIEDYDEKLGMKVSPLVKVAGSKTVFQRDCDEMEIQTIPRE